MNAREHLTRLFGERIVVLDGAMGTMLQMHRLAEPAPWKKPFPG